MARKATTKKAVQEEEPTQSRSSLFDYLRFGESYTSLILGIIVVIISTVLLLSFVHNKNTPKDDNPQLLSQKDIALPSNVQLTPEVSPTAVPTKAALAAVKPTAVPTAKPIAKPTAAPTKTQVAKAPTPTPVKVAQGTVSPSKGEYTVAAGDSLWTIAEKTYKSGYNWVDIARANNLSNPSVIHKGTKLKLPKVEQKIATVEKKTDPRAVVKAPTTVSNDKINGTTYTVQKGDTLWSISVRSYGNGYQWQKISSANNLSNPRLIHSGNKIKIPRG